MEYYAVALKLVRDSAHVDSTTELTRCSMLAKNSIAVWLYACFNVLLR